MHRFLICSSKNWYKENAQHLLVWNTALELHWVGSVQACWSITRVSAPPLHLRERVQKELLCEKGMQDLPCQFPHQSGERKREILALTSCSYTQTHIQGTHTSQSSAAFSIRGFLTLLWWDTLLVLTLYFSSQSDRNRRSRWRPRKNISGSEQVWTGCKVFFFVCVWVCKRHWTSFQNGYKKSSPRDSGTLEKAWNCK